MLPMDFAKLHWLMTQFGSNGPKRFPLCYERFLFRAVAKALDCTIKDLNSSNISIINFKYENKEIMRRVLSCMNETEFYGVSVSNCAPYLPYNVIISISFCLMKIG